MIVYVTAHDVQVAQLTMPDGSTVYDVWLSPNPTEKERFAACDKAHAIRAAELFAQAIEACGME